MQGIAGSCMGSIARRVCRLLGKAEHKTSFHRGHMLSQDIPLLLDNSQATSFLTSERTHLLLPVTFALHVLMFEFYTTHAW